MKKRLPIKAKLMLIMMKIMGLFMPSCKQVSKLVSDSLDHKLPLNKKIGVRMHLMFCQWCRNFEAQMVTIRSQINAHNDHPEHSEMSPEARQRLNKTIQDNK